ncbi:MAG: hypothetical protein R3316_05735, partial [Rhodovibrionaceae bacterium]|nr:hypothetical protein [Rhodovibrionaceae bacterium]
MRRFAIGLIVLLAVVGLAATAALVLRKPLAEHLVQRVLAERGYPEARLEFETLNAEEAVISRLTLGPDRPLAADRLHIVYAPGKLAAGDLRHLSIRLSGLAVQLDFTAPEGAFAALLGAPVEMEATETKQAPDAAQDRDRRQRLQFHNLPNIAIDDARIVVITQEGRARIEAAAKVGAAPTPDQLPRIAASGRIESEDVPVTGSFEANLLEGELDASFDIASERGLAATLAIKGDDLLATPELDLRGRAEVPAQEPFAWEVLGLPPPQDGVARIEAAFAGQLESLDVPVRLSDLLARLARGGWNGHASFQLDGLSLPDVAEGLRATGSARANIQDDGVRLTLVEPWTFGLDSVADPILANLGLPAEAAAYLDEPVNGTLALPEDGTFAVFLKKEPQNIDLVGTPEILLLWAERSSRLRWQSRVGLTLSADGALERFRLDEIDATARDFSHPLATVSELALSGNLSGNGPDDLQGSIDLSLELPEATAVGYRLTGFTAELPLDVRLGQNEGRVETRAESRLRVEGCRIPGSARIVCPLELRLAEAWLDLSEDTLSYAAEARLSKFEVHLPRQDDTPLDLAISPAQIAVTGTLASALPENIRINGFDVVLAGYGLAAEDIEVELRPGAEANFARFSVTRFSHRDEPSFLAPLRLEG